MKIPIGIPLCFSGEKEVKEYREIVQKIMQPEEAENIRTNRVVYHQTDVFERPDNQVSMNAVNQLKQIYKNLVKDPNLTEQEIKILGPEVLKKITEVMTRLRERNNPEKS